MSTLVSQNWYILFYFLNDASVWDLQSMVCIWKSHKNRISWNFQGSMPWSGWKYAGTARTGSSQVMDVQRSPAVHKARQWQKVSSKSFQTFQTRCHNFRAVAQLWRCLCQMGRFSNSWNRWCQIEESTVTHFRKVSQECYSLQHKYHPSILIREEMSSQKWEVSCVPWKKSTILRSLLGSYLVCRHFLNFLPFNLCGKLGMPLWSFQVTAEAKGDRRACSRSHIIEC